MNKVSGKKILFVCGREPGYTRNKILIDNLKRQKNQLTVISSSRNNFIHRHLEIFSQLTSYWIKRRGVDLVFVGFYGYLIVPLVKIMYPRKPLYFDVFVSTYETIKEDPAKFDQLGGIVGKTAKKLAHIKIVLKFIRVLDKLILKIPDQVLIDTLAHKKYFVKTYGLPADRLMVEYVGYDQKIFFPKKVRRSQKYKNKFLVFYYGTNQPLQGVEVILRTAKECEKNNKIHFLLIGPIIEKNQTLIKELKLKNTEFIRWATPPRLAEKISQADLCLGGHFGQTQRAKRVIAGKTFQFLAMKKPTIVSQNKANQELKNWSEWKRVKNFVHFCPHGQPKALAQQITKLSKCR